MILRNARSDCRHLIARLLERDAGFQARERAEEGTGPRQIFRRKSERPPELFIAAVDQRTARRQHADDRVRFAVDQERTDVRDVHGHAAGQGERERLHR